MVWQLPNLAALASMLHPGDVSGDWRPEAFPGWCREDAENLVACQNEREDADRVLADFEVVDLEHRAAAATYGPDGPNKRTRYRRVRLSSRRVVISLHQTGVDRTEGRWRKSAHRVTCHRFVGPTGARYRVHPLSTRLVATNRFDRAPWHCIAIELGGNFERIGGTGTWYKPDRFGFGRATDAQLDAAFVEVQHICQEVADLGGVVEGIVPHVIAGRDRRGRPNRQACPGSRQWAEVGERAGAELGLAVPAPGFALGGEPVPEEWHGPYWPLCDRFLTA